MEIPADHPPIAPSGVGILLINLGTPDAPTPRAVRAYLAEFLSDRRVVEIPPLIWKTILHGVVLRTRPRKSAKAYAQVWTEEGSPLAAITRAQCAALAAAMPPGVRVDYAMRYGNPGIAGKIAAMKAGGCDRILIAPLYPQYCAATTATAFDAAAAAMARLRWQPAIRTLPPYFDDPDYIEAIAAEIEAGLAGLSFEPEALILSFHGMPQRTLALGDPYHCHCQKTARLVSEALGRPVRIAFQSRFGRAKWLEPAFDRMLEALARDGTRSVAVAAPGFAADCLETLEEIAIRGRETFLQAGGPDFAYLPCLNASPAGIDMLAKTLRRELEGWIS